MRYLLFLLCLITRLPRWLVAWGGDCLAGARGAQGNGNETNEADDAGGLDVVCISHVHWTRDPWQRNHHVMARLAGEGRVIYCHALTMARVRRGWREALAPARRDPSGVWLTEALVLPGSRVAPWVNCLNAALAAMELRALARRAGLRRPVLWFYYPELVDLAGRLGERCVVYDIQDDYVTASPELKRREDQLVRRADQVFTGTHFLAERSRGAARRMEFVPCGVDFAHFHAVRLAAAPLPEALRQMDRPVLGYFGVVDHRLDYDLIEELARRRPQWHFVLVGPVLADARQLDAPNVRFLGPAPYAELPRYAQAFDVCLIPFAVNAVTEALNPTKTLEYFALERPVVSSCIPDMVRFYGDIIRFASTADEWERAIAEALEKPDPERLAKGLEIARGRSWEAMTQRFVDAIRKCTGDQSSTA
jgi:glycosyltransferase involved in cell wall biosynthesis